MGGIPSCQEKEGRSCEKNGLLWYPTCREGYHAVGCCVCSPDCPSGFSDTGATCNKPSYGRGAGTTPSCSSDKENDTGLCYNRCNAGYSGAGPVCYANCPAGWKDTGVSCQKDSYGNGAGTPLTYCGDKEYDAGLCYNKCPAGYKGVGPLCYPSCPQGWKDTGVACQKDSYGRGAGTAMNYCGTKEFDAGLCYNKCEAGYSGAGPVCYATCPPGWKDTGVSCQKNSYGNGAGRLANSCPAGKELVDGNCYDICPEGWTRSGTGCAKNCPPNFVDNGNGTCQRVPDKETSIVCPQNLELIDGQCYPKCLTGFVRKGTSCVAVCGDGWKVVNGKCQKDTTDNSKDKVSLICPDGYVNKDGKCYKKCPADYPYAAGNTCYKYDFNSYVAKLPSAFGLKQMV